jgi:hypothetical protein
MMYFGLLNVAERKGRYLAAYVALERLLALPHVQGLQFSHKPPRIAVTLMDEEVRTYRAKKSFTVAVCRALADLSPGDDA